jgi:ABC-type multidrug transport system ATPase subunit
VVEEAELLCDTLSIIKDGRVEITGKPHDIKGKVTFDFNFQVQITRIL